MLHLSKKIQYHIIYMWNCKKIQQTSEYNKNVSRLTDTENKLVVTSVERSIYGWESERHKLLV